MTFIELHISRWWNKESPGEESKALTIIVGQQWQRAALGQQFYDAWERKTELLLLLWIVDRSIGSTIPRKRPRHWLSWQTFFAILRSVSNSESRRMRRGTIDTSRKNRFEWRKQIVVTIYKNPINREAKANNTWFENRDWRFPNTNEWIWTRLLVNQTRDLETFLFAFLINQSNERTNEWLKDIWKWHWQNRFYPQLNRKIGLYSLLRRELRIKLTDFLMKFRKRNEWRAEVG